MHTHDAAHDAHAQITNNVAYDANTRYAQTMHTHDAQTMHTHDARMGPPIRESVRFDGLQARNDTALPGGAIVLHGL